MPKVDFIHRLGVNKLKNADCVNGLKLYNLYLLGRSCWKQDPAKLTLESRQCESLMSHTCLSTTKNIPWLGLHSNTTFY